MKLQTRKRKKNKKTVVYLVGCLFLLGIIFGGGYILSFLFRPGYKVIDRTSQMQQTEKKEKDTVLGWIRVEGTNIDMAIIYRDKDTDLQKLDYDFAWSYPKTKTLKNRAVISSHNVLNVSSNPLTESKSFRRFEALPAFLYPKFAEENQFVQYSVGKENYLYQIFSVAMVEDQTIDYDRDTYEKEALKDYIKQAKKDSYYDYDLSVNEEDSILTMITCTRFFGATDRYSLKIEAKKVPTNAKRVKLRVKSNYQTVEDRMKEGDYDATA